MAIESGVFPAWEVVLDASTLAGGRDYRLCVDQARVDDNTVSHHSRLEMLRTQYDTKNALASHQNGF